MKIGDIVKFNRTGKSTEEWYKLLRDDVGLPEAVIESLVWDETKGKIVSLSRDTQWIHVRWFDGIGSYSMPTKYLKCLTPKRTGHHLTNIFKDEFQKDKPKTLDITDLF